MDDTQRIVKCGNLSLHTPGGFFKKRWHSKYLVLYDGSKSGVKRLELFDSEIKFKKQNPAKIIPLVDCVRVVTCQRNKTTYTFEVRTSDQFYLLAGQSFQDMNDWVNCLRLVAFGQQQPSIQAPPLSASGGAQRPASNSGGASAASQQGNGRGGVDVLLEKRNHHAHQAAAAARPADYARPGSGGAQVPPLVPTETHPALAGANGNGAQRVSTASQAAAAAASALAKTRQRQPSLLGSCKPQPPTDSPFIQQAAADATAATTTNSEPLIGGQLDTMTPTVRGQLISSAAKMPSGPIAGGQQQQLQHSAPISKPPMVQATLDEEEENMLYCSIEDNPSEHNYRVKVIETELSLRCQLKCYQLTASSTVSQQYEQLGQFKNNINSKATGDHRPIPPITFYQLIIGPQELTLLNDYAALTLKQQQAASAQQQGLWSWPYQCIRRYGFDKDNCFMFEAGRKCTSGPGQFIVQTPKAYSIYQDVVKFVNELRSLSASDVGNALPAGNATALSKASAGNAAGGQLAGRQQAGVQVTQIPVTWTPAAAPTTIGGIKTDTVESRQQFFNTLRQLDSSGHQSPAGGVVGSRTDVNAATKMSTAKQSASPTINLSSASALPASTMSNNGIVTPSANQITSQLQPINAAHQSISASPTPTSDAMQSANSSSSPCKAMVTAGSKGNNGASPVPSPEETDESGYDQGDDSVDSSKQSTRFKQLMGAASRKRQAQDSMSSASSTSSGGSPAHSVSRRSNAAAGGHQPINGQGPSKRPPLTSVSGQGLNGQQTSVAVPGANGAAKTGATIAAAAAQTDDRGAMSQNQKLLGMLVAGNLPGGQPEDFEANLIRDVYSEITKLHAKFAVARSSAEDSLSNNSSNEESTNSSDQSAPSEQCEPAATGLGAGCGGPKSGEPMYSNLRIRRARMNSQHRRVADLDYDDDDIDDDEEEDDDDDVDDIRHHLGAKTYFNSSAAATHQRPHQSYLTQQQQQDQFSQQRHNSNAPSYVQSNSSLDYLSLPRCGPIYPTMLNPIPECGEVAPQQQQVSNQSKSSGSSAACASNNRIRQTSKSISSKDDANEPRKSTQKSHPNSQRSQAMSGLMKSKLPTNHYVINDVQYAKISRNICSKYESCL